MGIQSQVKTLQDLTRIGLNRSYNEVKPQAQCKTTTAFSTIITATCTLAMMLMANICFAQQIRGTVQDFGSKLPIFDVRISNGKESTFTDINGRFSISIRSKADTLQISKDGYKKIQYISTENNRHEDLTLQMGSVGISLREVQIRAKERYKADSVRMRKDFSNAFQYKGPGIQDLFMGRSGENRMSLIRDPNTNSTASIVHVNLLQIPGFFARKKNARGKLQQQLLEDEKIKAIDQRFSRARIVALTSLRGDSLLLFMDTYRPGPADLEKKSDYELMLYIRQCHSEFTRKAAQLETPQALPIKKGLLPIGESP